jgi:hypothetical protein
MASKRPTTIAEYILRWMVVAGKERGCKFDGWAHPWDETCRPTKR